MYFLCIVLFGLNFIHNSWAVVIPKSTMAKTVEAPLNTTEKNDITSATLDETCVCGVFLTGQFKRGSPKPPTGNPVLLIEPEESFPCGTTGVRKCTTKCLEILAPFLREISPSTICSSAEREIFRERTYLFLKNCNDDWISTRMSAGREYCCNKNHDSYSCPNVTA